MKPVNFFKTMLLAIMMMVGWVNLCATTQTITITPASAGGSTNLGSNGYGGTATTRPERTWEQDDVTFGGKAITTNQNNTPAGATAGQYIQMQATDGIIYNTTAIPGKIVSITMYQGGTAQTVSCYGGTTRLVSVDAGDHVVSGTQVGAANTSGWTSTDFSNNYTFFALKRGAVSTTAYFSSIEIEYEVSGQSYVITPASNNTNHGTVSLSNNVITATPASCYTYANPAYTVSGAGTATVSQNGNAFTVTALTGNVTITINFAPVPDYVVLCYNKGEFYSEWLSECGVVTLPAAPTVTCAGWTFAGWAKSSVAETTTAPVLYGAGTTYTPTVHNEIVYAVYSKSSGAGNVTASLNQAEIQASTNHGSYGYYEDVMSASGTWKGQMMVNTATGYLQIRANADGSHILSPSFAGTISSVAITTANNTAANRTFMIMDVANELAQPTITSEGVFGYHTTTVANESFVIDNLSSYSKSNFKIYCVGGAGYISSIVVTCGGNVTYNSNPTCVIDEQYGITPVSSNNDYGTVSLSNNVITATPASCYTYAIPAYTVVPEGKATVSQNGDNFTVTDLEDDVTVTINFTSGTNYLVSFSNEGEVYKELQSECGEITLLAAPTATCAGWTFAGWAKSSVAETISAPVLYGAGTVYSPPTANETMYAVYAKPSAQTATASLTSTELADWNTTLAYANEEKTLTNAAGDWNLRGYRENASSPFIQIRDNATPSYVKIPVLPGNITQMNLEFTNSTGNPVASTTLSFNDAIDGTALASKSVSSATSATIEVSLPVQQTGYIQTSPNVVRISSIEITYKILAYHSNPSCVEPLGIPIVQEATDIDSESFTANWSAVDGADGYELYVFKKSSEEMTETESFNGVIPEEVINAQRYTSATYLPGWTVHYASSGNTFRQIYTSIGNFGATLPALAFIASGDYVETRTYENPVRKVRFWVKPQAGTTSSTLIEGYNGTTWVAISDLSNEDINSSGETIEYDLEKMGMNNIVKIKFTFTKATGNLAIDDIAVTYASNPIAVSGSPFAINSGSTTSFLIENLESATDYFYYVKAKRGEETSVASANEPVKTDSGTNTLAEPRLNGELSVYTANNNIYVSNLHGASIIYVYNAAGQLAASQKTSNSNAVLPAPQKGVLMVKIVSGSDVQTVKVINK